MSHDKLIIEFPPVLIKNIVARVQNSENGLAEDVEKMIRDWISSELKNTKKNVSKSFVEPMNGSV